MVPNKEEPESDSELTEEDATQPEQPEKPAEPAVENAVAEEPAAEEALQHVVDAAELTCLFDSIARISDITFAVFIFSRCSLIRPLRDLHLKSISRHRSKMNMSTETK